jgi:hypothetical protein
MPAWSSSGVKDGGVQPAAQITSVAFFNSQRRRTTIFATGEEARAEVELVVQEPIEDVLIEVYFYSAFGNLHSHLSTEVEGNKLNLAPGRSVVEFICPEIPLEAASFKIEASIRRRESSFNEHIDYKHAAGINIIKGKSVHGVFHTPHTWRLRPLPLEKTEDPDAVVKTAD